MERPVFPTRCTSAQSPTSIEDLGWSAATVAPSLHSRISVVDRAIDPDVCVILDDEIVCVDPKGRPQFNDLLFHRGEPRFFAFDLLHLDGKDLRYDQLADR
jgi:ATP-dependent DNA ligase